MDFKNLSKKNVYKFKNKIVKKQNKLPNELIREILLYSKSIIIINNIYLLSYKYYNIMTIT